MRIKEFLGAAVLDKNAVEVGEINDLEFDPEEGAFDKIVISLKSGIFSKETVEVSYENIAAIGDYVLLDIELPKKADG